MLSRIIINKTIPVFQQTYFRLLSSFSKNYICDSSVIEAYKKDNKLKSIIDRQEHQFYYHVEDKIKQDLPSAFKQLPGGSQLPENVHYLTK
jgi:hypothetical protein